MAVLQSQAWKRMKSRNILALILIANACAVAYEGFAQGVIGVVNSSPEYLNLVGIAVNNSGKADRVLTQGGITCIYYFGTVLGCPLAGWLSDTMGRIVALQAGALWCMLGVALEASAFNQNWIICARLIAGVGVAHMNCVAPTWVGEISEAAHRGKLFALVYLSNYTGIAVAYWIGFGLSFVDEGQSAIRWRLPFALNAVPPLLLFCLLPFLPESPRYLMSANQPQQSLSVLAHVRAEGNETDKAVLEEYNGIKESVEYAKTQASTSSFIAMIVGSKSGKMHFPRRTQLALWLPLFTQVGTGIAATTIYTPSLIQAAGWGEEKALWLSALNNTVGILGTIISMYTIDPVGRRLTLLWGSLAQSACMWIIGVMSVLTTTRPASATQYGSASVAFIFVFTLIYSSTFLIINFNYPAEIFPTEVRSRGMAVGITGWAVGLGAGTLYNPVMFNRIGGYGFFIYGGLNIVWFVLIYLFLPETSRRSLEAVNRLFETRSPFVRDMERHYISTEPTSTSGSEVNMESDFKGDQKGAVLLEA